MNTAVASLSQLFMARASFGSGIAQLAKEDHRAMARDQQRFGEPNPRAPAELSQFAFLIGVWRLEAKLKRGEGNWESLTGTWEGRYILDGYAIEDVYRMSTAAGELLVLGTNFRAYDPKKRTWNMKWLNALAGTWTDLGPEELGGIQVDEKTISYCMQESVAPYAFLRATYTRISADHFTWRGEGSKDRKTWEEFLIIQVYRTKN